MAEQETGINSGRRLAQLWWVLPFVYLLVSIVYQGFIFPFLPGGTERYHFETDCFILEIRFPLVLTVANQPGGEVSQPASFWVWNNPQSNSSTCAPEARIAISHDSLDLVWLEEKQEIPASWLLTAGNSREEAAPRRVFVYLAPQENLPSTASLSVLVDGKEAGQVEAMLWSAAKSGWFRLANLLLGSQNLALVTGAITLLTALYKFFQDAQARRQQQQKDFESAVTEFENRAQQNPEQIAKEYLALLAKTSGLEASSQQREWLIQKFHDFSRKFSQGNIWSRSLRLELAERLNHLHHQKNEVTTSPPSSPAPLPIEDRQLKNENVENWLENTQQKTKFLSQEQYQAVLQLQKGHSGSVEELRTLLIHGLRVLRALGVESGPHVIAQVRKGLAETTRELRRAAQNERLTPTAPSFPPEIEGALKEEWFEQGKASGHYLLELLSKEQPEIRKTLLKWEETPTPPNPIKPPFGLWGSDPVYETRPEVLELFGQPNPRWKHPFGPLKAEDDPRLPLRLGKTDELPIGGLFWEEHPLWETAISLEPCYITAPRGSGGSAMQLMGRHLRRFWGRYPSLSLGFSLSGKPEINTLWYNVERALSETLRRDLVEDPYWLLNGPPFLQEWVVSFFEHVYGNIWKLSSRLQEAGLPQEETDLVMGALHAAAGRNVYQGRKQLPELILMLRQRLGEAARYRLRDNRFEVFLWVEIKDADFTGEWLDRMAESGLLQVGLYKIFAPAKNPRPTLLSHVSYDLKWNDEQLTNMLNHRFKQTKQTLLLETLKLDIPKLVQGSSYSPARLIESGNRIIQNEAKSIQS
ncbi:MAG: hypothetical protein Fur0016_00810 [Anaerolineales bacterium]